MPPPWATNPAPKTESAREARKSFYCELCQKGYSRVNEFEAHEGSYDHQHKKRLKEMKQMSRDPLAAAKARKAEKRADEKSGGITIKPVTLPSNSNQPSTGFKKGGFRNAFAVTEGEDGEGSVKGPGHGDAREEGGKVVKREVRRDGPREVRVEGWKGAEVEVESESDEEWGDYDPRQPTGCGEGCVGR